MTASAKAGPLVASVDNCEAQELSKPFLPWADVANYQLAPQGTFESGAGSWELDDASVVGGNEVHHVAGEHDTKSLRIAAGGSATSDTVCVGIEHPTIRLFARRVGGSPLARLTAYVNYENVLGVVQRAPIGTVLDDGDWDPTAAFPILVNLLPLLPGQTTPVSFTFAASGDGDWRIDDVYVDPWRGG